MVQSSKIEVVEETAQRLNRAQGVVVVDYRGLTVPQMNDLRNSLRETGSEMKVVKNRLTKRALEKAECDSLDDILVGPTALVMGYDDPVSPARVCMKFAGDNGDLEIRGGLLERRRVDLDRIAALARLPGRAELLTQVATTLTAPARQIATAINQAMAKIVYAMKGRADQMGA